MRDNMHRSDKYEFKLSKQAQKAEDLLNEIKRFLRYADYNNIKLNNTIKLILNGFIDKLKTKQSGKVLRSIQKDFLKIQQQYN